VRFATAFFYPPQEHLYLADDAENMAVLDSLINHATDPWADLSYNFFPNPVKTFLNVEIYLPQAADVHYQIHNTMGSVVLERDLGSFPGGLMNFQINASALPVNNYILDIWLNGHLISGTILKR
jgi:hypothetical protein